MWSWTRASVWRSVRRARLAVAGGIVLSVVVLMGATAPVLAPQDPAEQSILERLKPPGFEDSLGRRHYLGTDQLGRDILSRLMYGARVSLVVGITAVCIGGTLGLALGLVSGYYGGWVDGWVIDRQDAKLRGAIEREGKTLIVVDTVMSNRRKSAQLAQHVVSFARTLASRR